MSTSSNETNPLSATNYRSFWEAKAGSDSQALSAVDNSGAEAVTRATGAWAAEQLRHALELNDQDRVLDLGCGAGRIGRELAADCGQWIGVDVSPRMLEVAQRRMTEHDNTQFIPLARTRLDMFGEETIDKAYSVAVLCHMDKEDLFLYLRELHRILVPGGLAYLETWNLADEAGWQRWMYEVEYWDSADQSQRKDVSRNQFCAPGEFRLYAERAGFQVLAQYDDSPWIQLIAGKALERDAIERQRRRLAANRHKFAYSPMFGQLFDATVPVIYGQRHPRELLAELDRLPQLPEVELHRTYVLGIWQADTDRWGEVQERQ